jgi:PBP1b-binding outer membrane lipoprotein LpoB
MHRIFAIALTALLVTACSKQPPPAKNTAPAANTNQPASVAPPSQPERKTAPGASTVKADFTNAKTAVDTFVAAAQAKDLEALSQCFDPANPGEFQSLIDKTATENQLQKLASHFEGAKVMTVQANGDDATARVSIQGGEEDIQIKKTASGWKIINF